METLSRLIEKREPVAPDAPCAEVAAMFDADPTAAAIAVIQDERPVGVVYRDVLQGMLRVAGEALAAAPIAEVMDSTPRIVPAESDANAFVDSLRDSAQPVFRTAYIAIDEAGRYVGVGGLTSLLSVHQRRRNEARDARALIERMAMDIGDHLDGVLAITARLEQQRLTPDAAAFVRAISDTSRDMSETVGRAIDLHRSAQGHLTFKPEPTRLRDLADAVEARWAHRAQDSGSTLLVSYDGDPECGVELDGERLMQVFDILVENALAGGRGMIEVRLAARPEGDLVRLDGQVRDNTAGHDAEERLARLAGPMGQPSLQDRSEIALSVGLALARRIMRAMGAPLHAEANRGAGVTVGFSLIAGAADTIAAHDSEPTVSARAAHILIVDDNATNRMVAEALCDMFDCTSEQAVDGVEAVEMARGGRFDLILMDIKMPRMDGVAATRAIRDMGGRIGQTPVVALTANADPLDVQTYIAAGMQDVVEKPIKPERLAVVLSALLGGEDEASETEAA